MQVSAPRRKRWRWVGLALLLIVALLSGKTWRDTLGEPVVHETTVELSGLEAPVRLVLISDIHVAGPDMPPSRLADIVRQINALEPDIVTIAGDLVSEKRFATHVYTPEEIVAPLGKLTPRFGTYAVPGNHDHWFGLPGLAAEMDRRGIVLLANQAAQAGPIVIGGLDDDFTGHADIPKTIAAMDKLDRPRIVLSHSPDPFPDLPRNVALVLAGHTHCGQIRLPLIGAISHSSRYGDRYGCGRVDENGRTVIVGAGLGTSVLPVRFGTTPEIWLIQIRPPSPKGRRPS